MQQPMQCPGCGAVLDGVPRITEHMEKCVDAQRAIKYLSNPNTPILRMAAADVVKAWERLGACHDEFDDYNLGESACGEYADALDVAIIALKGCLPQVKT